MVKLRIEIGKKEESREELLKVAKRIDEGEDVEFEKIVFESYEALRKVLTPERLKVLHVIKEKKPKSVYELAKLLGRDRRNVVKDLGILEMVGLVKFVEEKERGRKRKVPVVPYDEIEIGIPIVS